MEEIVRQIKEHDTFYIFGHIDPDGDCIGSQLGLATFLNRIGKKAHVFSKGKFERQEIKKFQSQFSDAFEPDDRNGIIVIIDCSAPDRTGFFDNTSLPLESIVIDHHSSGNDFGNYRYVQPQVSACTMLILKLIETMGEKPTKEEAELLMLGLCTDTGFFRHLTETGAPAFETAAKLTAYGAAPNKIYFDINGNKKPETLRIISQALSRATMYLGGKLVITYDTLSDYENIPRECRDIDTVYMLLLATEGVEVVAAVKEDTSEKTTVGLRTRSESIDLGKAAAAFGGGGHRKAAGFKVMNADAQAVIKLLVEYFSKILV